MTNMKSFIYLKRGNYADCLPPSLHGKEDVRRYVRSLKSDEQRLIVLDIEQEIKSLVGENKGWCFRAFSEEELEHLSFLLEIRSFVLDELALHPTKEEVARLELLNDKLLRMTQDMNARVRQLQLWAEKIPLMEAWKRPYVHVEGTLEFCHDTELPALTFPNDDYYGSDFNYTLQLIGEVTEVWKYPNEFTMSTYKPLDDGQTWADGYLMGEAYQHLCICYALHALCCHLPYSIPDVLRMDNITLKAQVRYENDFYDPNKEKRKHYGLE